MPESTIATLMFLMVFGVYAGRKRRGTWSRWITPVCVLGLGVGGIALGTRKEGLDIGEITGVQFAEGAEDQYRVHYADNNGNPHEEWWRASLLESVDDADNNVICFSCAKAAREARNATKH